MSSDSTRVQLRGPKELGNCCSSDYQDHEHQHILNHIAPLQSVHHVNNDSESRIVSVLTIDKHTEYFLLQEVLKCFADFSTLMCMEFTSITLNPSSAMMYAWHLKIKMVGKHIVDVLPLRVLCAKYQWSGTTEAVVNVQKASCVL